MDVRSELSGRRSKKRTARPKGISEQILSEDYWEGYYALGDSTVVKCIDAEDGCAEATVYSLTNGFKDFDSFTKGKVKKEVRKGRREWEHTLNGTKRNADGSLKMVTSVKDDPESFLGSDFKLAL